MEEGNQEGTVCLIYLNCVLSWTPCFLFLVLCIVLCCWKWRCNLDIRVWARLKWSMLHSNVAHGLYPTVLCRCWPACSAIFRGHEVSCLLQSAEKSLLSVPLILNLTVINWLANLINRRNFEVCNCFLDVSHCISDI